ncbi:hypothetical protein T08_4743 [Trichinella sp. T8]|nr:hypothetical protein T08_4743 [Trichinella sp. T8]
MSSSLVTRIPWLSQIIWILEKYFPTAEFLDEVVQKTIRLVDVVETLMLFQERYVLAEYELPCMLVPVSPVVVTGDLKNNSSVN